MIRINKQKMKEWLVRYIPSEILGIITAYIGFYFAFQQTQNFLASAYAASLTEVVGFYIPLLLRDLHNERLSKRAQGLPLTRRDILVVSLVIMAECGIAELLDSLFLRPIAISYASQQLGPELGVLVGKIIGDMFFYIPAIAFYEYRKSLKAKYEQKRQQKLARVQSL